MEEFEQFLYCIFDTKSWCYVEFTHRMCCRYDLYCNTLYVPYAIKINVLRYIQKGKVFSRWEGGRLVLSYVD